MISEIESVYTNKYKRLKGVNKEIKLVSFWSFDFFIHWSVPHFCQLSICYKSAKEKKFSSLMFIAMQKIVRLKSHTHKIW